MSRNLSRFQRGSGLFNCRLCKRSTRDVGDNGSVRLCSQCYDLAGEENCLSDSGKLYSSAEAIKEIMGSLDAVIGAGRAAQLFPEVAAAAEKG